MNVILRYIRHRRCERAMMALVDARRHHAEWIEPFNPVPSTVRHWEAKLIRMEARVVRLGGDPHGW